MKAPRHRVCLIEDDAVMGEALADRFEVEGFACDWHKTGMAAKAALEHKHYDVVVSDVQLPDIGGDELFMELSASEAALPPFLFITGYGTLDVAVHLLKLGARDYLTKPLDIRGLLETVRDMCGPPRPAREEGPRLGISGAMRAIEATLPRLAQNSSPVLITGESGVGKEEVARALHRNRDPDGRLPFIAVNCGALTESLLEAELFGYVKGAFTGAVRDRKGVFEQADGGTLFLDEVGEMSPVMQVKLLRAIQERQVMRIGGEQPVSVAINLVCATHQDLTRMVQEGRFREDLYYRIHVIHLHVPPLRERRDDILWLARRLLAAWGEEHADHRSLHASAEKALMDYPWPGNIRELKHCLDRACILSRKKVLTASILFGDAQPVLSAAELETPASLNEYLHACEKRFIEHILRGHDGRIADTAAALGISRKNLWEKMKKLRIQEKDGPAPAAPRAGESGAVPPVHARGES